MLSVQMFWGGMNGNNERKGKDHEQTTS